MIWINRVKRLTGTHVMTILSMAMCKTTSLVKIPGPKYIDCLGSFVIICHACMIGLSWKWPDMDRLDCILLQVPLLESCMRKVEGWERGYGECSRIDRQQKTESGYLLLKKEMQWM